MARRKKKRHRSFGEHYVKTFLEYNNIKYTKEKTFSDCVNAKNNKLRFDFHLIDYNILIEYQGMHHYKPVNKYSRAKRIHRQTIKHDEIKRQYCDENNIALIEIHYLDLNKIYDVLIEGLNSIIGES